MPSNYLFRLGGALRQGIRKSISGKERGLQDLVAIFAEERLLFGKFFCSVPSARLSDLHVFVKPGTLAAAQANSNIVNQRKNLSVVGAIPRAFSIPSVSGPAFQVCGYHIDHLLAAPTHKEPMAICCSRTSVGCSSSKSTSWHLKPCVSVNSPINFNSNRNFGNCRKASMSLRNNNQPNNFLVYGYFAYNVAKSKGNSNLYEGFGFKGFHSSPAACISAVTAPDVSFDNSLREVHLGSSATSSEQNIHIDRNLKLNSGSCYLPHPDKEETGGEDAHFICIDEQAFGIADGVGGWADVGVDAGKYARELMSNSVNAIREEPKGSVDPARVLEKAYTCTKAKGSSTACIIALTDQGLSAINLGDSGFMVVRDGCTVFRSPVQQHDFNFTYQLESGGNAGDSPSSGEVFKIPVAPGDVIIAGTDGLFDNLYSNDITAVVVHATRAGLPPQVAAQKIAALARQRAQDKNRQTPFSSAAQEAGFRYYGGKLDDITVVVSYITSDKNENSNSLKI
ncbi:probable protein phosphatase 2C 55 isoform X1 [Lycium ferocissimum]|uniref:probable protein phosphatase 2C 55 isoform X1 n=1 Tax=Lycium ferocissimum TaxID=112874 RepID=UPI002814AACD|nr:probable protein phosphatase 2C 55 isoform X1 [Lycium ferocissimum]XP_059279160.1 probable protein phosphatase 2C 55 isoform X1 [Lycium ferocissimum]XP_059279161.1 probable protein phosphatase 2C 55 isoform X1 [Lycium ferocissimum]XP_059279162.1 probable protein phosphatase 2C 55 isoform X1 [Lycium ferocissimum]XP_059279163.1 probable protein phosphatase 2C 55 isoform X1 [Lycium ferocissimum]